MNTILITGGCGFIGTNLCRYLLKLGKTVICLDNLYCSKISKILDLIDNPKFFFQKGDIRDWDCLKNIKCDTIFNLACPASPPNYLRDPIFTMETCFIGTKNVLELAKLNNAKILLASTSEVYGDPTVEFLSEDYFGNTNSYGPRSCYDEGKRIAESLFYEYRKLGVDTRIVRIFNTFGEYMEPDDGRVLTNFILRALLNKPLEIYGNGNQTRCFLYIEDLIKGFMKVMNNDFHGIVNLGSLDEITINDMAYMIIDLCKSVSYIKYLPGTLDDPKRRKPDISKAISLGWEPNDIKKGLLNLIDYLKKIK